jgi:F-type H+-transporting ATPase subunit delta
MRPTALQYAQAIDELHTDGTEKVSAIAKNFFAFLKRRGEGEKAGAIVSCLEKMEAEKQGRVTTTVVTAHEVAEGVKKTLLSRAEKLFPTKKIELVYEVDESVIGGALFRTDEVLYDATLASELKSLKAVLKK